MKAILSLFLFIGLAHAEYKSESPLPKGWPAPGPFDTVVQKQYPVTRLAVTENKGFMTLFRHIKKNGIPMTAPVVSKVDVEKMEEEDMQFLYQDTSVGSVGADGNNVEVKDIPKLKVLTYAWIGKKNKTNEKRAKTALSEALKARGLEGKVDYWRTFSYNSPFKHKRDEQCHELQVVLK